MYKICMNLKIRLARRGRRNAPFFELVLAESRSKRDSFKKRLGYYNPLSKEEVKLTISEPDSLRKYLQCGAQPTDRVKFLLKKANFEIDAPENEVAAVQVG